MNEQEWTPNNAPLREWTPEMNSTPPPREWVPPNPTQNLQDKERQLADIMHGGEQFRGPWTESPGMSTIYGFTNKFDKLFHGILQPLLSEQTNNRMAREREKLLSRSQEVNPLATMLGGIGGEAALMAPAFASGGGLLGQALAGAGLGAAKGAGNYIEDEDEESRLMNGLLGAGTGALETVLPSAAGKAFNYAKQIPLALNSTKMAEKILVNKATHEATKQSLFKNFLKEGNKSGIKVEVPKFPKSDLIHGTPKQFKKQLNNWVDNPNVSNSHDLYKATGRLSRRLDKKIQANTATTPEIDTYNTATKLHKIVEKNMHKAFEKAGRTDLSPSLAEANKHYVENVLTHRNPLINKYKRGELTESDLISGLLKNKTARKQLFPQYPELGVRKSLPYVAGGIGIPAASYLGLPSAIGYLSGNK